jgi:hypothetical protein
VAYNLRRYNCKRMSGKRKGKWNCEKHIDDNLAGHMKKQEGPDGTINQKIQYDV